MVHCYSSGTVGGAFSDIIIHTLQAHRGNTLFIFIKKYLTFPFNMNNHDYDTEILCLSTLAVLDWAGLI